MGDTQLIRFGTEEDGDPARGCPHMAEWWPVFAELVRVELGLELEILQAQGSYSKSGATHVEGTAVDWRTWRFTYTAVMRIVRIAREMGARATWYRTRAQGFDPHAHSAIDCPCWSGADYQTAAVDDGFNGLGGSGRGGRDDGPAPSVKRDYRAGIAWAKTQIARLTTPTQTDIERLLDTMDTKDLAKIIDNTINSNARLGVIASRAGEAEGAAKTARAQTGPIRRGATDISLRQEVADAKSAALAIQGQMAGLTAAITQLAKGQPIDLAAIEAAAKRGVEDGLAGARVVVELGD